MVHSHLKTGTGLGWLRHPGGRDGASSPLIHPLENLAHWQWGVGEAERGEEGVTCLVLAQVWGSAEKGGLGKEVLSPGAPSRGVRAPSPSTEDDVQREPGADKDGGPCLSSQPLESEARGL